MTIGRSMSPKPINLIILFLIFVKKGIESINVTRILVNGNDSRFNY